MGNKGSTDVDRKSSSSQFSVYCDIQREENSYRGREMIRRRKCVSETNEVETNVL